MKYSLVSQNVVSGTTLHCISSHTYFCVWKNMCVHYPHQILITESSDHRVCRFFFGYILCHVGSFTNSITIVFILTISIIIVFVVLLYF